MRSRRRRIICHLVTLALIFLADRCMKLTSRKTTCSLFASLTGAGVVFKRSIYRIHSKFIFSSSRTDAVYGMMMHTVWDPTRVIDFTPGCGSLAIECIRRRKSVLLVCRSLRHKKTLCKMIKERLAKLTRERTDSRFFRHMPGSVDPSSPVTRDSEVAVVAAEGQANEETSLDGEGHVSSDGNETD